MFYDIRKFIKLLQDEENDDADENNDDDNYRTNSKPKKTSKYFKCKTKIIGSTPADNNKLHAEFVVPSKYLSDFLRSLNLSFINWEVKLNLRWTRNFIIPVISRTGAVAGDNPVEATATVEAIF